MTFNKIKSELVFVQLTARLIDKHIKVYDVDIDVDTHT